MCVQTNVSVALCNSAVLRRGNRNQEWNHFISLRACACHRYSTQWWWKCPRVHWLYPDPVVQAGIISWTSFDMKTLHLIRKRCSTYLRMYVPRWRNAVNAERWAIQRPVTSVTHTVLMCDRWTNIMFRVFAQVVSLNVYLMYTFFTDGIVAS